MPHVIRASSVLSRFRSLGSTTSGIINGAVTIVINAVAQFGGAVIDVWVGVVAIGVVGYGVLRRFFFADPD